MTLERVRDVPSVYLLAERAAEGELDRELKRHYKVIWLELLQSWYRNAMLPRRASYKEFRRWFTPTCMSMVVDVSSRPLIRDDM